MRGRHGILSILFWYSATTNYKVQSVGKKTGRQVVFYPNLMEQLYEVNHVFSIFELIISEAFSTSALKKVFFFFLESFNIWHPLLMIILYHQTKILIGFW